MEKWNWKKLRLLLIYKLMNNNIIIIWMISQSWDKKKLQKNFTEMLVEFSANYMLYVNKMGFFFKKCLQDNIFMLKGKEFSVGKYCTIMLKDNMSGNKKLKLFVICNSWNQSVLKKLHFYQLSIGQIKRVGHFVIIQRVAHKFW